MIEDIPRFNLAPVHELYTLLLKPVEAGWKSARHLIVETNGALGTLPLGLLPTAPADLKTGTGNAGGRSGVIGFRVGRTLAP